VIVKAILLLKVEISTKSYVKTARETTIDADA